MGQSRPRNHATKSHPSGRQAASTNSSCAAAVQEEANQRIAARDGQQDNLLPYRGFFDLLFALARDAGLFLRDEHERVLRKINAAFVARAAVPLRSPAGRALEEQGSVAPPAESLGVAIRRLALGTFHASILPRRAATHPGHAN